MIRDVLQRLNFEPGNTLPPRTDASGAVGMFTDTIESQIQRINSSDDLLKQLREINNKFVQIDCDRSEFTDGLRKRCVQFAQDIQSDVNEKNAEFSERRASLQRQEQMIQQKFSDHCLEHGIKVESFPRREEPPVEVQLPFVPDTLPATQLPPEETEDYDDQQRRSTEEQQRNSSDPTLID